MPLMYRTVREESGACPLLKNPAVRASATATSFVSACMLKFEVEVGGVPGLLKTASMFPWRSLTATAIGTFTDAAACCTTIRTSSAVRVGGGGLVAGSSSVVLALERIERNRKTTTTQARACATLILNGFAVMAATSSNSSTGVRTRNHCTRTGLPVAEREC